MNPQGVKAESYYVEVSGWDISEKFFVEKAPLDWDADGGERISLRSKIREGVVVFVRLIQSVADVAYPMAYQATQVGPPDAQGLRRVAVVQLRPRLRPVGREAVLAQAQPLEN
jgi:hypothetical protein